MPKTYHAAKFFGAAMTLIKAASPDVIAIIKHFEGNSLNAYLCPAGRLTIGYGHVLQPLDYQLFNVPMARMGEIIKINQNSGHIKIPLRVTQAQAEMLLTRDIAQTALFLASVTTTPLKQYQFDALCSFIFNNGQGHYAKSTLCKRISAGDIAGAASEFDKWVFVNKQKLPGLVRRRAAERRLFEGKGLCLE